MEKNKIENPSAFPHQPWPDYHSGMTLLDYFAAQAMAEIIPIYVKQGNTSYGSGIDWDSRTGEPEVIAQYSYKMGKAMLEERKKYGL